MSSRTLIALGLLGLSSIVAADTQTCGSAQYDPNQYVCRNGDFLCPIVAGEPLSYCNGACYSTFMYQCNNNALVLLPALPQGTPFTLTASNPKLSIDGWAVNAEGETLAIGGSTASYCPDQVKPNCPPGTTTALVASGNGDAVFSMDVEVPGGQQVYLNPYWDIAYTQAHSAYIPPGSLTTGLAAYQGGGFVNLNGNGAGWVACPPTAMGGGGNVWALIAKNSTNAANLGLCTGVNLKVNVIAPGPAAWQYT